MAAKVRADGGISDDQAIGDAEGSAKYLRSLPITNGKVGVIGSCSGGRLTCLAATRTSAFNAAVDLWGTGSAHEVYYDDISVLGALACVGNVNGDCEVNTEDLVEIILNWGPCPPPPCPHDIDGDGMVGATDLVAAILGWGVCP